MLRRMVLAVTTVWPGSLRPAVTPLPWQHGRLRLPLGAYHTGAGPRPAAALQTERLLTMRFLLFLCILLAPLAARAQDLTVFAAASLTDAMKDISALWVQAGHPALRTS